jgi:ketosteroid isomerase-like protein
MNIEELEGRVARLENIEAIKELQRNWAYLIDEGDWRALMDLFADDCVFDDNGKKYESKDAVTKLFRDEIPQKFSFKNHMLHNPFINIEGDKAVGRYYIEAPLTHAPTNRAIWALGQYDLQYVRVRGEWKIKHFAAKGFYTTPFDEGWARTRMMRLD